MSSRPGSNGQSGSRSTGRLQLALTACPFGPGVERIVSPVNVHVAMVPSTSLPLSSGLIDDMPYLPHLLFYQHDLQSGIARLRKSRVIWASCATFPNSGRYSTRTVHDPTRTVHDPTRTVHDPTRTVHDPTRTVHDPTRTVHDPTRTVHDPTRTVHDPTRTRSTPPALVPLPQHSFHYYGLTSVS